MKKFLSLIAICATTAVAIMSCGSAKTVQAQAVAPDDEVRVIKKDECQFMAEEKPETRAWGLGEHFRLNNATSLAEADARAKFARAIATSVKTATESSTTSYTKNSSDSNEGNTVQDGAAIDEDYVLTVAKETVKNTVVINSSQMQLKNGTYRVYVCLEYKAGVSAMASAIAQKVEDRIPEEDKIKMQYDRKKFIERIEKELKNQGK